MHRPKGARSLALARCTLGVHVVLSILCVAFVWYCSAGSLGDDRPALVAMQASVGCSTMRLRVQRRTA